jgi:copper resistance protein C
MVSLPEYQAIHLWRMAMNKLMPMKVLATAVVALALSAVFPVSAHHQFLQQAFPSAKSHASAVSEVRLMFDGKADALFSTMKLKKADGSVIAELTQPKASREMVMPTPRLSPGNYLVEYRVLATDGEVVKGDFFFTVDDDRS